MRIAIFDGSFETTAFIRRLIKGLVRAGHEVYVLGFNEKLRHPIDKVHYIPLGSNQNKWRFVQISFQYLVREFSLEALQLLMTLDKRGLQARHLDLALERIQPDVVHLQWVSNIKLFEKHLEAGNYRFILSQRGYQTNVRPFVDQDNFAYLAKWLPEFAGFHSVSQAISKVGDKVHHSPEKIDEVVYTGLELKVFDPQYKQSQNPMLQLISVGRPHWKKGYDLAIRAIKELKDKGMQVQYDIIGGKGDEALLFLIHELGLTSQVHLYDKMPQQQVFEHIRHADVFLLPSIEEGIANVAVEAMALGTPVISSDCGGMQELITHEHDGWIFPVYDVKAMARTIAEFCQLSDETILEVKHKARKKVEEQHSETRMVEGMLSLYAEVVGSPL